MSTVQTEYSIQNLIKPILEEQTNATASIRKSSYDTTDYKIKYKTEKCRYWSLTGTCPYKDLCAFAHSEFEIRQKIHTSKNYKTKLCNNFRETGFCKYGQRCQFKHQMKQISKMSRNNKQIANYEKILQSLPQKYCQGVLSKRLKIFSQFQLDNFEEVDWHYRKARLYSL